MASLVQYFEDFLNPDWSKLLASSPSPLLPPGAQIFLWTTLLPVSYLRIKHSLEALSLKNNSPEIRKKRSLLHEKFTESKVPTDLDYIVIGSGSGGLSCAALLARLGRKVLVLEQHYDVVGGGTHMFDLKGFPFDSGLHYTVPWSVPLLALTCLKKPKDCVPFDMMTENDGTIDKLFIINQNNQNQNPEDKFLAPLRMRYHEGHIQELYQQFPHEKTGIDAFLDLSNKAMAFVKVFIFARLLPKWLQTIYWKYFVPSSIIEVANQTAQELLPKFIKDSKLISIFSSMWIDTGCRPDKASFMLTASVFRGISLEGGCYPRGGSTEIAKDLVTVIESNGGKVLIRADVDKILFNESLQRVDGVKLKSGVEIRCGKGVISSTSYLNTMNNLVDEKLTSRFDVPRSLPLKQSAGFVMANIGINSSPQAIGATKANTWHIPVTETGDIFAPLKEFFEDPLNPNSPISAFITFPSVKDISFSEKNKTSCQILMMAEFDWFKNYLPEDARLALQKNEYDTYAENTRVQQAYDANKELWKQKSLEVFLKYFPKAAEHISFVDISTPLSIQYYLRATQGGAVGIDSPPERFCDPVLREQLDPITKIPGLSLTGQDTTICGVVLCQMAGVITALRLEGLSAAVKILFQSILLGNQ